MRFPAFSFPKEETLGSQTKNRKQLILFPGLFSLVLFGVFPIGSSLIFAQESEPEILFVKSVSLSPSTLFVSPQSAENPKVIKGTLFPGVSAETIKKINYSLRTREGSVLWERSVVATPKGINFPFVFDFSSVPLSEELVLNAELLIQGDVVISNTNTTVLFSLENKDEPFFLSEISNIETINQDDSIDLSFEFQNNNTKDEFQSVVLLQSKDSNAPFSKLEQSELVSVGENQKEAFSLSFKKPTQPQLYTFSLKVLDKEGRSVAGTISREWLLGGSIAKVEKIEISPLREWKAGENIVVSLEGSTNKPELPLEALIQLRSLSQAEGEWFLSEKVLLSPKEKSGVFSQDYAFSAPEKMTQLTAKITLSQEGAVLHERQFVSPVFKEMGITEKTIVKMEQLSNDLQNASPAKKLSILGGGSALLLLLIFFVILAIRAKKKKNTIHLFLLAFVVLGFVSNVRAEQVSILYPYFAEEQYSANNVAYFDTIPLRGILFDTLSGGAFDSTASAITGEVGFSLNPFEANPPYKIPFSFSPTNETEFTIKVDIGEEEIPSGNYFVTIFFQTGVKPDFYSGTVALQWGEQADGTIETVLIDKDAPTITVTPSTTAPTNQSITITVDSIDAGAGAENPDGDSFNVVNNFCTDTEICNTEEGARTIRACDKVGNCSTEAIEVSNYDTAAPTFGIHLFGKLPAPIHGRAVLSDQRKATDLFKIDLTNVKEPVQDPSIGVSICDTGQSFFHTSEGGVCEERHGVCALSVTARGTLDRTSGECTPDGCGEGYIFDVATNECIANLCPTTFPFCFDIKFDCEETQWLPDVANRCEGEIFDQISNCGNTRTATGTSTDGACAITLVEGLVAHYLFDGTATDMSGNGNNGIITEATFVSDRQGNPEKAIYFNGVDNFVEVLSSPTMDSTSEKALTFITWIKTDSGEVASSLFRKTVSETAANQGGYYSILDSDSPTAYYPILCQEFTCWGSMLYTPIQKEEWHQIAVTMGQETLVSYYVDGNLVSPQGAANLQGNTEGKAFYIGKPTADGVSPFFKGTLDDTRVYNTVLTAEEIKAIYDSEVSIACVSDAECDDINPCTQDNCSSGNCINNPLPSGTPCDGGTCDGLGTCSCAPLTCADYPTLLGLPASCGTYEQGCGLPDLNCGSCPTDTTYTCNRGTCECVDISWSPSPSTVCSGSPFPQTSNCNNTRTEWGTKSCSKYCRCCASGEAQCVSHSSEVSNYTTESACLSAYQNSYGLACFRWE